MSGRYRLLQEGMAVAWAEGPSAFREIGRYTFVYGRDGPVTVEVHDGKRWKPLYSFKSDRRSNPEDEG